MTRFSSRDKKCKLETSIFVQCLRDIETRRVSLSLAHRRARVNSLSLSCSHFFTLQYVRSIFFSLLFSQRIKIYFNAHVRSHTLTYLVIYTFNTRRIFIFSFSLTTHIPRTSVHVHILPLTRIFCNLNTFT